MNLKKWIPIYGIGLAAFAADTYGKNITAKTSEIASEHDAILAINGDYYGVRESGCVIRNGVVYRDI